VDKNDIGKRVVIYLAPIKRFVRTSYVIDLILITQNRARLRDVTSGRLYSLDLSRVRVIEDETDSEYLSLDELIKQETR
jgi:hypothetical protein